VGRSGPCTAGSHHCKCREEGGLRNVGRPFSDLRPSDVATAPHLVLIVRLLRDLVKRGRRNLAAELDRGTARLTKYSTLVPIWEQGYRSESVPTEAFLSTGYFAVCTLQRGVLVWALRSRR
jgi:hypothetical protein